MSIFERAFSRLPVYPYVALLFTVLIVHPSYAEVVLLNDDFQDGNRDGWFLLDQGDVGVGDPNLSVVTTGSLLGSSSELGFSSTSNGLITFAGHFSSFTLNNAGDQLRLRFDAHNIDGGFFPEGLNFGFFNSNGTLFTVDGDLDFSIQSLDDNGVYANVDAGNFTQTEDAFLRINSNNTSARLFDGTTIANNQDDDGNDPLMFTEDTNFTYDFLLTRNQSDGLDILLSNNESGTIPGDNGALLGTIASPATFTFDTLYFGANQDGPDVDFRFDNISVTAAAVPEPGSIAVLLVGAGIVGVRRRRLSFRR